MIFVAGGNSVLNRRLCLVGSRLSSCMIESRYVTGESLERYLCSLFLLINDCYEDGYV